MVDIVFNRRYSYICVTIFDRGFRCDKNKRDYIEITSEIINAWFSAAIHDESI